MKQIHRSGLARTLHLIQRSIETHKNPDKHRVTAQQYVACIPTETWIYGKQRYNNLELLWCMSHANQFTFLLDGAEQIHIIVTPDIAEGLTIRVFGASHWEEVYLENQMREALNQEIEVAI
jgi:hypothetical protein